MRQPKNKPRANAISSCWADTRVPKISTAGNCRPQTGGTSCRILQSRQSCKSRQPRLNHQTWHSTVALMHSKVESHMSGWRCHHCSAGWAGGCGRCAAPELLRES